MGAQREALVTLLGSSGAPYAFVDARQVEEGWLGRDRPKLLVLSGALAMSDREVAALREYVHGVTGCWCC